MNDLLASGADVRPLEITDIQSRQDLVSHIENHYGCLDALVNNAGFGKVGPIETMSIQTAQSLFDVNVFGLIGLTQMVLPAMRQQNRGRIINVSSIAGQFVTPGAGWYGASKFALEALSDGLRLELHPFGIKVVIIEPGLIDTGFETIANTSMAETGRDPAWDSMMRKVEKNWQEGFRKASSADVVAATIQTALDARTPKARYRCGYRAESAVIQKFLPTKLWDSLIRMQMT